MALDDVRPSERARELAARARQGPAPRPGRPRRDRAVVLRAERGVLICRTHHGFVCANAGVDASNAPAHGAVVLLPRDPDASARALRARAARTAPPSSSPTPSAAPGATARATWPIGIAGLTPRSRTGAGAPTRAGASCAPPWIAVADEAAAAADLVRDKDSREPAVVCAGSSATSPTTTARARRRSSAPPPRTCSSDVASVSPLRRPGYGSPHESFQNTPRRGRRRGPHRRCRVAGSATAGSDGTQRIRRRLQAGRRSRRRALRRSPRRRHDRLRERRDRRRHRAHRRRRLPAEGRRSRARSRAPRQRGHRPGPQRPAKVRRDAIEKPAFAYERTAKAAKAAQGALPSPASRSPTSSGTCA